MWWLDNCRFDIVCTFVRSEMYRYVNRFKMWSNLFAYNVFPAFLKLVTYSWFIFINIKKCNKSPDHRSYSPERLYYTHTPYMHSTVMCRTRDPSKDSTWPGLRNFHIFIRHRSHLFMGGQNTVGWAVKGPMKCQNGITMFLLHRETEAITSQSMSQSVSLAQ